MKTDKRKVALVGCGMVGMSYAYAMLNQNVCDELVLIDVDKKRAEGEAMDMNHGLAFSGSNMKIFAGSYDDCGDADIVCICAGVAQKPGETRLDLLQRNAAVFKSIIDPVTESGFNGLFLVATNPVDIMTRITCALSGFNPRRVLGTGTALDTARLRARIAEYLSVSQKNVHAYVFGEHGETSFVPWSIAEVSTISLADYKELIKLDQGIMVDLDYDEIDNYMRSSGGKIIRRKGCTNYAIAVSVCGICECLQGGVNAVVTVSTMLSGEYGISDVCLSLPMLLGNGKVQGRITPRLTDEELEKLHHSADALKAVIAQIDLTMPETKA